MPSVNLIQFSEPRIQPANPGSAPAGDPFGELLDSVSAPPRADVQPRDRQSPRQEPAAQRSRPEARSKALERDDVCGAETKRCANEAPTDESAEAQDSESVEATGEETTETAKPVEDETSGEELTVAENVEEAVTLETDGETVEAESGGEEVVEAAQPIKVAQPVDAETNAEDIDSEPNEDAETLLTAAAVELPADANVESSTQTLAKVPVESQAEPEIVPPPVAAPVEEGAPVTAEAPQQAAPETKTAAVAAPASSTSPASNQSTDDAPVNPVQPMPIRASGPAPEQPQMQAATQQSAATTAAPADNTGAPTGNGADPQTPQKQPDTQPVQAKPQEIKPSTQLEIAKPANPIAEVASAKPQPDTLPEPVRALAASLNPASVNSMTMRAAALNERAPVPLTGTALAAEIVSRVRDGMRRFDIRLDPPELGRVDVRMEVDRAGNVKTHMTVDRPETLELVQREARGLERALQQAGLKTDGSGLEFSLRSNADHPQADGYPGRSGRERDAFADEGGERIEAVIEGYRSAALARGGVDIRI